MYKRPSNKNAFQYKEPKAKMRKLDVSLSSASNPADSTKSSGTLHLSRPSTSKVITNDKRNDVNTSVLSNTKPAVAPQPQAQPPNVPPSNDENLWGDADDECILIASQMVDNMDMDAINQQIIVQSMNMSQNNAVQTKVNNMPANVFRDMLQSTEEEDRLFSELPNFDNIGNINQDMNEFLNNHQNLPVNQKINQINSQRPASPSVFKIPTQIRPDKRTYPSVVIPSSSQNDLNISFNPQAQPQSTQFSQRIPKPSKQTEAQAEGENLKVKFLTQKQCDLQKKIEHLESENQKLTDQCQMKDGEASLLRSEFERLKAHSDQLRKEKSDEIAKNKYEHGAKISELEKEILNLKSQLQFKEIPTKQFRKFSHTALSQSIENIIPESSSKQWEKFILPNKSILPIQVAKPVDPRIYISSNLCDSNWISIYDKQQCEYLNGLQVMLADLMANKDYSNNGLSKTLDDIFNLASLSANEMYASSMGVQIDLKRNEFSYSHSEIGDLREYSIVSENKLFHHEEAFFSRRILICLATICEQFPQFSSILFVRNCVNDNQTKSFLEFLSLTLNNLCHYRRVANVQGLVESSCLLLTTLAVNNDINMPNSLSATANVLHNILLSRPGIGSLEKISKFLELMSYRCQTSDFLNSLCLNKNTQDISEPQRFIRYTTSTCTLQIYALFIRLYMLPHEKWKFNAKQLTAITQSTLLFMRNSFLKSPKWLSAGKRGNCLCRARLFGATVTLLYVYLLHWIEHPSDIDSQTLLIVSKFGVEFFYENLVKNFEPDLLNTGGTIIKNRIRLVVEWLNLHDFQFKAAHRHALQTVCLQRLGPMVEHLRYNKNITKKFSEEASELYNNVIDSFFVEYN